MDRRSVRGHQTIRLCHAQQDCLCTLDRGNGVGAAIAIHLQRCSVMQPVVQQTLHDPHVLGVIVAVFTYRAVMGVSWSIVPND